MVSLWPNTFHTSGKKSPGQLVEKMVGIQHSVSQGKEWSRLVSVWFICYQLISQCSAGTAKEPDTLGKLSDL